MRLRKQLFFLSLVTLALPWVGCQYIREMDSVLRKGQADSLTATAQAVSARISSDRELTAQIPTYPADTSPLYVHSLHSDIYVDGNHEDWISQGYNPIQLPGFSDAPPEALLGRHEEGLVVFLRIPKDRIHYFNPSHLDLSQSDHVYIDLSGRKYALFSLAPGKLSAIRSNGETLVNDKTREHQIKGKWSEWRDGYQMEFTLPFEWARDGIRFGLADASTSTIAFQEKVHPIVARSERLSNELAVFSSDKTRLHLIDQRGHLIASSGTLEILPVETKQHGFLEWLYKLALGDRELPELEGAENRGILVSADIQSVLKGLPAKRWYKLGEQSIARVNLPLHPPQSQTIGAVVAEQSADSLSSVTNSAFSRLLAYSFLASTFAGICLVAYATWLSIRIRKLSDAAAHAVSESGKISDNFPVSNSQDEVGELSRSYSQLLSRLREYTSYLRTLSSKLSHELRTPLAIVRSSLDNLEHEKLGKQAKVYAERAREGTTRLSNILNAMSAASRVEQAIGAAERETIPCDQLLSSLKDAYEDVYQHVCFKLNIRKDSKGLSITGSGELLVQALDKLVDNAADFCPEEGVIELGLYRHQDHVVFTVHNEGPPLPSHMHGQLFDSMVSVRDKSPAEQEGHHLGLGLYIVRLITDFHQGEVQGYNVPDNSGVIFEVRLPANNP